MSKYKILWHSSQPVSKFPDYRNAILGHAKKVLGPEVELVIRGVEKGTPDTQFFAFDFLNNAEFFQSVVRAEKEGFDAVALGCFLDPILDEFKEIMQIPVMGMAETGMATACMLGKRFSVITYMPQLAHKRFGELIHKYGMLERSAGMVTFNLPFAELERGYQDPSFAIDKFVDAGREAIAKGAEVLIPGCGSLNLILMQNGVHEVDGATVVDVSGVLMKMTEMMVVLGKVSGTRVSRLGLYESPAREDIERVLKMFQ